MSILTKSAAGQLCAACMAKHEQARLTMISNAEQRSKEIVAATDLKGSAKQIEWAERIREEWRSWIFELSARRSRSMDSERDTIAKAKCNVGPDKIENALTAILSAKITGIEEILTNNRAAWWIDNRKDHGWPVDRRANEATREQLAKLAVEDA